MAKHQKGKQVSKGVRISCVGNTKKPAAIIIQAERVGTAMREAFLNMKVASNAALRSLGGKDTVVDQVLNSAKQNAGNNKVGRGWSANLSPRTVRQLTQEGVFA